MIDHFKALKTWLSVSNPPVPGGSVSRSQSRNLGPRRQRKVGRAVTQQNTLEPRGRVESFPLLSVMRSQHIHVAIAALGQR